MCDEHRHLGKTTTTSYSGRDFANELEEKDKTIKQLGEKRSQIIEDLNKEIVNIFDLNNYLKAQLSKETGDIPEITEKSEKELLEIFNTLKEENNILVEELNTQKEELNIQEADSQKEAVSTSSKEIKPEVIISQEKDTKKTKRPFFKKLSSWKNK